MSVLGSVPLALSEVVLVAGSAPPLAGAAGSAPLPVGGPSVKTSCLLCTQKLATSFSIAFSHALLPFLAHQPLDRPWAADLDDVCVDCPGAAWAHFVPFFGWGQPLGVD